MRKMAVYTIFDVIEMIADTEKVQMKNVKYFPEEEKFLVDNFCLFDFCREQKHEKEDPE
jgi:hypothetical protein